MGSLQCGTEKDRQVQAVVETAYHRPTVWESTQAFGPEEHFDAWSLNPTWLLRRLQASLHEP
jgi:hypothetical protein